MPLLQYKYISLRVYLAPLLTSFCHRMHLLSRWLHCCRIQAILFESHNSSTLVTLDMDRLIASLLSNALSSSNSFIFQNVEDISDAQLPTVVKKELTNLYFVNVFTNALLPLVSLASLNRRR